MHKNRLEELMLERAELKHRLSIVEKQLEREKKLQKNLRDIGTADFNHLSVVRKEIDKLVARIEELTAEKRDGR